MTPVTLAQPKLESPEVILGRFVESLYDNYHDQVRVFIDPDVALGLGIQLPQSGSCFATQEGTVSSAKFGCIQWICKGFDSPDSGYICPMTHRIFGEAELALEVIFIWDRQQRPDPWQRSHWYGQSFDCQDY
jgi:hypothetical protein